MYYLITGDMSSFYGYGDRTEMIIDRHYTTTVHSDLDDAREHGMMLCDRGVVDGWVVVGPDKQATWNGLIFNNSEVTIPVSKGVNIIPRKGWDARDEKHIPWDGEESK